MTMTMKSWLGMIGVGLLILSVGCTERAGIAPTELASNTKVGGAAASSTYESPVVTLQPDLTADPATISVAAGYTVLVVNNSTRYVRMRSNCSEFITMGLQPGVSRHTMPFETAGQTCDYFVWDTNWSRKIFVGTVNVTP